MGFAGPFVKQQVGSLGEVRDAASTKEIATWLTEVEELKFKCMAFVWLLLVYEVIVLTVGSKRSIYTIH